MYTLFDSDQAGQTGVQRLKDRFGGKIRNVELPEENGDSPDITDWVVKYGHTADDLDTLVTDVRGGGLLLTVHDAFKEHQSVQNSQGIQFGVDKLDLILRPGLLPGQVLVVLAKSGTRNVQLKWGVLCSETLVVTLSDRSFLEEVLLQANGGPHGSGVLLCEAETLPTPTGWSAVHDVAPGASVFDRCGRAVEVRSIEKVDPAARCTRLSLSDGSVLSTVAGQVLELEHRYGRRRTWTPTMLQPEDLFRSNLRNGSGNTEWRWRVPDVGALRYPERHLPLDPYVLGAIVANGCSTGSSVTVSTPDPHVIERLEAAGGRLVADTTDVCPRLTMRGTKKVLRELGLDGLRSNEKFIPSTYLESSPSQRIALLHGLMDGDGTGSAKGRSCVRYSTTSPALCRGLHELVVSLGGTCVWATADRSREGKPVEYTATIMLPATIEPFSTPKKRRGQTVNHTRPHRAVIALEEVGPTAVVKLIVAAASIVVGRSCTVIPTVRPPSV